MANRKQWRAYGRVCVTLRSAWFKAFKRALCATLTNRNYPVTPLSLAWFFQFLSRFYTLSCTRMCKKIYPVYLFPRALVFIDREGKMNKIKLKLSCIYNRITFEQDPALFRLYYNVELTNVSRDIALPLFIDR